MATFNNPNSAVAGNAIIASEHNGNWTYLKQWLEGVAGNTANYPGVVQNTGGAITGGLTVSGALTSGTFTSSGTTGLGASNAFYFCLLYTSPSPRDGLLSRMPSSA